MSKKFPGRQGKRRDLERGLQQAAQLITPEMGDRPNVPNVCLILTSATENDLAAVNQTGILGRVCHHQIVLRVGSCKDLQTIPAIVCPRGKL